jgi:hypothetical protein
MSRSRKKNAFVKDSGNHKNFMRKLSHSRVRKQVRQRLSQGKYEEPMPLNRELTNQWSVCDWKWYFNQQEIEERCWFKKNKINGKFYLRK